MKNRLSAIAETCHPASARRKLTECNWHRISVSFWSSFAFIGWVSGVSSTPISAAHASLKCADVTLSAVIFCETIFFTTGCFSGGNWPNSS